MDSHIQDFYDEQFLNRPELREAYAALGKTQRRVVDVDGYPIALQHNPARVHSTAANTDAAAIASRPCFLCRGNRPIQQLAEDLIDGWEILINPFPIFPVHFTVASKKHEPQQALPVEPMVTLVDALPELTAFFNGASAGASAPDHLHFQAVMKHEIPLLKTVEEGHTPDDGILKDSTQFQQPFPFRFKSRIIFPDLIGMNMLAKLAEDTDPLVNHFIWKDSRGYLRVLTFPRKAHRPQCYHAEGDDRFMVSPGAIDMAGILILPREEDFKRLNAATIKKIYSETSLLN